MENSMKKTNVDDKAKRIVITAKFSLRIECGHVFGFKWLLNELFKLGFSISYCEVNRFKKSVVVNQPWKLSRKCESKSIHKIVLCI